MDKRIIVYEQSGQTAWIEVNTSDYKPEQMINYDYTGNSDRVQSRLYYLSTAGGLYPTENYEDEYFEEEIRFPEPSERIDYITSLLMDVSNIWDVDVIEL